MVSKAFGIAMASTESQTTYAKDNAKMVVVDDFSAHAAVIGKFKSDSTQKGRLYVVQAMVATDRILMQPENRDNCEVLCALKLLMV